MNQISNTTQRKNLNVLIGVSQIFLPFSFVNDMTYVNQLKAHYWGISWQTHIHYEMNSYFCIHTGSWQIWEEINEAKDSVLQEKFMKLLKKKINISLEMKWSLIPTFFDVNVTVPNVRPALQTIFCRSQKFKHLKKCFQTFRL